VPEAHYLESWGDVRAFDGTVSLIQPLIAPIYDGRQTIEVLAALNGKTIILGVIALDTEDVESAETVAQRLRRALPYTTDLVAAPDCGMKYLTRESAFGKLQSLVEGAKAVSVELA
jgi:methionine synthase II (cobalamin-independent)